MHQHEQIWIFMYIPMLNKKIDKCVGNFSLTVKQLLNIFVYLYTQAFFEVFAVFRS